MAAQYLTLHYGWTLVQKNVHFREGELDLIMQTPEGLVFVEVKGRSSHHMGGIAESLTTQKIRRMKKAVLKWRLTNPHSGDFRLLFVGIQMGEDGQPEVEEFWIE